MARRFTRVVTTPAAARLPQVGNRPFVSLTSDWGLRDPSAAICRGVVLNIAPEALIVDITHEVDKYNIRHGALMLWCALPFMPVGAHVCVVDPGVGTARRPIAIETGRGDYLIGPDNGVLLPGAARIGGIVRVHQIGNPQYRLPVITATFHGRDLFTPAAAHLALGVPLESFGPPVEPQDLTPIDWPPVIVRENELETSVIYRDTFGNVKLAGLATDFATALPDIAYGDKVDVHFGKATKATKAIEMTWAQTFGQVSTGDYLVYEDSYGRLCIAQNQGDAARTLGLEELTSVRITRRSRSTSSRAKRAPAGGGQTAE
ncbi:MAG: SAM hydrolase/SAM-dependent halogenase family protein [Candidatus Limnocylindrales bacterium]